MSILGRLRSALGGRTPAGPVDNTGPGVGQWPRRALAAVSLLHGLPLGLRASVADLGCGRQTLRTLLPTGWSYHPFDALPRTPDTVVCDFDQGLPGLDHDLAVLLGVLEYLAHPLALLAAATRGSGWLALSYCHDAGPEQRLRQGWRNCLTPEEITACVAAAGGAIRERHRLDGEEYLYLIRGARPADGPAPPPGRAVLLSAAAAGDNAGDALIEDAVRRLTGLHAQLRLPLTRPLDDDAIAAINRSERLIVCGTNLYQRVFAGNLTVATIRRISVPITLLGIGSSDAMDRIPCMDAAGVKAVRLLHERSGQTSVRDEAAWRFLASLGIRNAVLTGCPVLFHGLSRPVFSATTTGPSTLSVRARLLHVDASWNERQERMLDALAAHFHPTVVLQSPYDQELAQRLQRAHGCAIMHDPWWQAPPYVDLALAQARTMGFRLHFCMLSLAHGRPAVLISHDSRGAEFCRLVGLPVLRLDQTTVAEVIAASEDPQRDWSGFTARWTDLAGRMRDFLTAEGLPCRLQLPCA